MICNSLELFLESCSSVLSFSLRFESFFEIPINLVKAFSELSSACTAGDSAANDPQDKPNSKTGSKSKKYKTKRLFNIQLVLLGNEKNGKQGAGEL